MHRRKVIKNSKKKREIQKILYNIQKFSISIKSDLMYYNDINKRRELQKKKLPPSPPFYVTKLRDPFSPLFLDFAALCIVRHNSGWGGKHLPNVVYIW